MPIYEFKCKNCGNVESRRYPINSNIKKITCWKCKGNAIKIISSSNFIMNGYSEKNGYSKGE